MTTDAQFAGQGSGGTVAILAAAGDPRIKVLDVTDSWGDWPAWLRDSKHVAEQERAAYVEPRFLDSVSSLDPVTYLPQLAGRALRVQQGMDDPATPARRATGSPLQYRGLRRGGSK